MAATDFVTETQVDSLVTNIATAVKANTTAHNAHLNDTSDAHDASAISVLDTATQLTATDVEAALAEIMDYAQTKTDDSAVTAHIGDSSAAHAASAISIVDAAGGGVAINDAATNTSDAWSSQKITDYTAAATAALIDSAPGALDTLNELAAAIGDDAAFSTTVTTALGLRLRVDAAQSFTSPQKAQGLANLGIVASSVDFAGAFNTAIA